MAGPATGSIKKGLFSEIAEKHPVLVIEWL